MVHITSLVGNGTDFEEFPTDNALSGLTQMIGNSLPLHLSISKDTGQVPTILLAIDRGWLQFMDALENHGVSIDLICEDDIQSARTGKRSI